MDETTPSDRPPSRAASAELSAAEAAAFDAAKDTYLWPATAPWVRHQLQQLLERVGATDTSPDRLLEALDEHWRASAASAAPHDIELMHAERLGGYRDPAGRADTMIRVAPAMPTKTRLAWSGLLLLVVMLALVELAPSARASYGIDLSAHLCGVLMAGFMIMPLVVHAVHRLLRRRQPHRLVRRQSRWIVDGTHSGDVKDAAIELHHREGEHVVLLRNRMGLSDRRLELYRTVDERSARIAALLFEEALR